MVEKTIALAIGTLTIWKLVLSIKKTKLEIRQLKLQIRKLKRDFNLS